METKLIVKYIAIALIIAAFGGIIYVITKMFQSTCPSGQTWVNGRGCVTPCSSGQTYDWKAGGCRPLCNGKNQFFSYNDKKCYTCKSDESWNSISQKCIPGLNPCRAPFNKCVQDFAVDEHGKVPPDACGYNAPKCIITKGTTGVCQGSAENSKGTPPKYDLSIPECHGHGECVDEGDGPACVCFNVPDTIPEIDALVANKIEEDPDFLNTRYGKACFGKKRYLTWKVGTFHGLYNGITPEAIPLGSDLFFSCWPSFQNSSNKCQPDQFLDHDGHGELKTIFPVLSQYNGDSTDFSVWKYSNDGLCKKPITGPDTEVDGARQETLTSCRMTCPLGDGGPDGGSPPHGAPHDVTADNPCGNRDRFESPQLDPSNPGPISTRYCANSPAPINPKTGGQYPGYCSQDWCSPEYASGNWGCPSCCGYQIEWNQDPGKLPSLGCAGGTIGGSVGPELPHPSSNGGLWYQPQEGGETGQGEIPGINHGQTNANFLPKWNPCQNTSINKDGDKYCSDGIKSATSAGNQTQGAVCIGSTAKDDGTTGAVGWCGCETDEHCRYGVCNTSTKQCYCTNNDQCSSMGKYGACMGSVDWTKDHTGAGGNNPGQCVVTEAPMPNSSS